MDLKGILRVPRLRRRILCTVMLLLLFRVLAGIPLLNVDEERLNKLLADNPLIATVDLFAGGEVLTNFSIVAAGIFPYLLAVMLVNSATWVMPPLRRLRRQGEGGKKRIEFYAKLTTIPLAFIFAWGLSEYLAQHTGLFPGNIRWFTAASFFPSLKIVGVVTLGSMVSAWIADLITKKGIGSGHDVILLAGASLGFVKQLIQIVRGAASTGIAIQRVAFLTILGSVVVVLGIYLVKAMRRVPIQSAKSGKASVSKDLPLLLNRGRILPVSSAVGLLTLFQLSNMFLVSHFSGGVAAFGRSLSAWITPANGLF